MKSNSFGEWFAHQLKRRDLTQADFARNFGFATGVVSNWVTGKRVPDPASCERIADALNVDPDMVLIYAGHRPNIEELAPDDPRTDLIALVRRVQWNEEREALIRGQLETMIKLGKGKGNG